MNHLRLVIEKRKEDNIIKYERNIFRLKKEIDNTIIKDIRNLFRM